MALILHSSRVLGLILILGYLLWSFPAVSLLLSSGFSGFLQFFKKHASIWTNQSKKPLDVKACVHGVIQGEFQPREQYSREYLRIHSDPD